MKRLFLCVLFCVGSTHLAQAACDMAGCASTVSVDSGNTGKNCANTNFNSNCHCSLKAFTAGYTGSYITAVGGSCNTACGDGDLGAAIGNRTCCGRGSGCAAPAAPPALTEIVSNSDDIELREVFDQTTEPKFSTAYYGWVNTSNRSPTAGRGNSVQAKLDACLFHTDVDNLGTGFTGYNNCLGSSIGCNAANKNEYCNNNGAEVCEDRCECYFGFGTCDNL